MTWSVPELVAVADSRLVIVPQVTVAPNGKVLISWQRTSSDPLNPPSFSLKGDHNVEVGEEAPRQRP